MRDESASTNGREKMVKEKENLLPESHLLRAKAGNNVVHVLPTYNRGIVKAPEGRTPSSDGYSNSNTDGQCHKSSVVNSKMRGTSSHLHDRRTVGLQHVCSSRSTTCRSVYCFTISHFAAYLLCFCFRWFAEILA